MTWLIGGLAIFAAIHFISASKGLRASLLNTIGQNAYRGVYSAISLAGLILIVIGWRSAVPVALYAPPSWGATIAFPMMFAAVLLFGASHAKTGIKRVIRHPQLTAVIIWSLAHLASNGDLRSLVLFGTLGVWSALEIALINRRDGEWVKPAPANGRNELIAAAVSVVVFLVLFALHPYFAGVSPLPA